MKIPRKLDDSRIAFAREYIEARSLSALNVGSIDLKHLLESVECDFDTLALLMCCHAEILERKAKRWGLIVERRGGRFDFAKNQRPPSSVAIEPRRRTDKRHLIELRRALGHEKRQRIRYAVAIDQAEQYIEEHRLLNNAPTKEHLEHLYVTLGLPIKLLGRLLKCSDRIRFMLATAGIDRRSVSEQKLSRYNATFFKAWSAEMAWVVGLLFTDGVLVNNSVSLASIDRDLLFQVSRLLGERFTISNRLQSDGRNRISTLSVHHPGMVADLRAVGLHERKSLTMEFPDVPDQYVRHFVRGCWDGDGGFSLSHGKLTAHYTCGSPSFINRVAEELLKAGVGRRILHRDKTKEWTEAVSEREQLQRAFPTGLYPLRVHKRSNANAYGLHVGSDDQILTLYKFLYDGVAPDYYLQRKHALVLAYLEAKGLATVSATNMIRDGGPGS